MSATIIGLDASIAAAGVAVLGVGPWAMGCKTIRPPGPQSMAIEDRMEIVLSTVVGMCRDTPNTFVALEAVFAGSKGRTAIQLGGLHYLIRHRLRRLHVAFAVIDNRRVKEYATGNGGASKEQMIEAAKLHLRHLSHPGDDNQADAMWLAAMAARAYVTPVESPPLPWVQAQVFKRVKWPKWTVRV